MDRAAVDARLEQLALLTGHPRELEELSGGLTNTNVKVTTPDGVYVARISGDNAAALGIDRDAEHVNTAAAAQAGVGPPVLDYRPDLGVLLIGYIEGRTLHDADLHSTSMLERVALGCRTLHAGPTFRGRFDMFERQHAYRETMREHGYRLPAGYDDHAATFDRVRRALAVETSPLVPCNNDLLAENFVDDGEKIWLIDYEYSGMNDACFELGNVACEAGLDVDELAALVAAYDGRARRHRIARARLQGAVGQYGWTLWGAIQHAVSPLDFDFWSWATERYDGAVELFTSDDLDRLLADVADIDVDEEV